MESDIEFYGFLISRYEYEEIDKISKYLFQRTKHRPTIGIICGSGLGGLADLLTDKDVFKYETIPNFPVSTVSGHSGCLVFGYLRGVCLIAMKGRFHPYEGYPMAKCAMPVRLMKLMGVKTLIVTNAAGGLNKGYNVGDIMIIKDQINLPAFAGNSPLRGVNDDRWGVRFPAMNDAYNKDLMKIAKHCAQELKIDRFMREGVYVMTGGPSYESVAEVKFLSNYGDAVGMSTCHEVTVAHHCGLKVVGFSLITNKCVSDYNTKEVANHEEVIQAANERAKDFERLIESLVEKCNKYEEFLNKRKSINVTNGH
ncbi:purine nucleoside phosphorylase-like [Oppia nitens]|uniref:purine nucleoside phosphorylase-like n=1 Tax=Oppia nitens TaxID=1686743 RepID=UPI0023DA3181|nr:purine nucleoside phosphorylase-like [Oppia nitens]